MFKTNRDHTRLARILCGLVIFLAPFAIYAGSMNNDFLAGDDEAIVLRNVYLRDLRHFPRIFTENYRAGSGEVSNYYRPFQVLMYVPIVQTVGITPLPFHLESIFFHGLCGLFLYVIFLALFRGPPGKETTVPLAVIALCALMWTTHPLHNAEIAVTTGIASPAHLFWMLFGLFAFIRFERNAKKIWYAAALGAFVLSLLSKESAIVFPGLLLGMHATGIKTGIFKRRGIGSFIKRQAPFWITAGLYVTARLTCLNFNNSLNFYGEANVFTQNLVYRLYTAATVAAHGLRIIFIPAGLHSERSWPVFTSFFTPQVFLSVAILTALAVAAWRLWRKLPLFTFGIFWFFFSYAPMSNIMAQINALVWDHWFYTPAVGVFLAIASIFSLGFWKKKKILYGAAIAIFVAAACIFSVITISRNAFWRDTESVSKFILTYEPQTAKTWNNLAMAQAGKGKLDEAAASYARAIELSDTYPQTHHNLANLYLGLGKYDLAEKEYLRAIELDDKFYHSYMALGKLYLAQGDKKKAAENFRKTLELYPLHEEARELLARTG